MIDLVLGLDLGTSGLKALVVDAGGEVVASTTAPYSVSVPKAGYSEQNPGDWKAALKTVVTELYRQLTPDNRIIAVGLSGQMHGSVLYDRQGSIIRPVILWNDQRTDVECDDIVALTRGRVVDWTWNEPRTAFTASKLLWVKKNEPENFNRIARITLPKDYIRFLLTGKYATDVTDASGTHLLDVGQRTWSRSMVEALSLKMETLPQVHESPDITGTVSPEAARAYGLPAGIPVVAGGADQAAAAIGNGITSTGQVSITLGTSGVVYTQTGGPIRDSKGVFHTFCHSVPQSYQLMAGVLSAAGSLSWLRNTVMSEKSDNSAYKMLFQAAEETPAGSNGLIFLPYLTGERSPHNDPSARGSWFGLGVHHGLGHLIRAVLEGVGFAMADLVQHIFKLGVTPSQLRIAGGGAKNAVWRQIITDILGAPVYPVSVPDASAYGAAILAASTAWEKPVEELCKQWIVLEQPSIPDERRHKKYTELHEIYQNLYPATFEQMHRLTRFDRESY